MNPGPRRPPSSVIAVVLRLPWDGVHPQSFSMVLATALRAALEPVAAPMSVDDGTPQQRLSVAAIGPHQINTLDDGTVTVTYPVGSTTVLSVQPTGAIETRPQGSAGVFEKAVLKSDRLIYAPWGPNGNVYVVPYADVLPNPE